MDYSLTRENVFIICLLAFSGWAVVWFFLPNLRDYQRNNLRKKLLVIVNTFNYNYREYVRLNGGPGQESKILAYFYGELPKLRDDCVLTCSEAKMECIFTLPNAISFYSTRRPLEVAEKDGQFWIRERPPTLDEEIYKCYL